MRGRRFKIAALLLALVVQLSPIPVLAGGSATGPGGDQIDAKGPAPAETTATEEDADWWSSVQENLRASEYHVTWQEQTYLDGVPGLSVEVTTGAYQAPNRDQGLRTYFVPAGPIVIPRFWAEEGETPPWHWQARLVAWGRAGAMAAVPAATLKAQENRIEYHRQDLATGPDLVEWYHNDENGLEQGFAIEPPSAPAEGSAPLRVDLALEGSLIPYLVEENAAIELLNAEGIPVLRYGNFRATDAAGRSLPVQMHLSACEQDLTVGICTLQLTVDHADASSTIWLTADITGLSETPDWIKSSEQANAKFGFSVATAGDVNGDGYSDVIVGAPYYDHGQIDEGRVFVYHGSASGPSLFANWVKEPDQAGAHFGWSVSTAGDVDGDGYLDIIVGAPDYDHGEENEGGVWVYHGSDSGLISTPGNFDEGNQRWAGFGYSVSTAGDVNDDGFSDVIVGAPYYHNYQNAEGRVWVWHGTRSGLSESHSWRVEGNQDFAHCGTSVATAGDVNRDGYDDVIIGVPNFSHGQDHEGVALVWHGSRDGVNGGVNGNPYDPDWRGEVNQESALYGYSVATAGDVNGDGYADVIVGAPHYSNGQTDEGGAWLYLGSSSGLDDLWINQDEGNQASALFGWSVATAGDVNGDGYADVIVGAPFYSNGQDREGRAWVWHGRPSGISGFRDWDHEGDRSDAGFGFAVATAGDVNGDGFSDIIIGSSQLSVPSPAAGAAHVFHGSAGTLGQEPGWTKASNQELAYYGWSVATAGDVNGDGYADVVVGARSWDDGQESEGGAWVYLGGSDGLQSAPHWYKQSNNTHAQFGYSVGTAGDVNGDGYDDVIVGAPGWHNPLTNEGGAWVYLGSSTGLNLAPGWHKSSNQEGAEFGHAVGTAGDVNGDGYCDVIVGAPFWQRSGEERGGVWIYHGTADGPHAAPDWYRSSSQDGSEFGHAVGTAGDVNRDGYSDVIVGGPGWDDSNTNEGRAWVFHGSAEGVSRRAAWHQQGSELTAQYGYAVGTAGDVNGDGYADIIVGAPRWDDDHEHEGKVWVYYGSGGGLDATSSWSKEGGQDLAHYGWSVGTAGDVNGDGYADVIIGIEGWNGGLLDEGGASVYHGSGDGLETSRAWHGESEQHGAHYGYSVGTAGDVNGDGYADVIIGAPHYDKNHPFEGQAFLYYGNGQAGLSLNPRQVRASSTNYPIAHLGWSDWTNAFCVRASIRTPFGPGSFKLEIEVKPVGVPFDGTHTLVETSWWAHPLGRSRYVCATNLLAGTRYHWRARWRYKPGTILWMPASRWVTMPWNGWNEMDLRTAEAQAPGVWQFFLPAVLAE